MCVNVCMYTYMLLCSDWSLLTLFFLHSWHRWMTWRPFFPPSLTRQQRRWLAGWWLKEWLEALHSPHSWPLWGLGFSCLRTSKQCQKVKQTGLCDSLLAAPSVDRTVSLTVAYRLSLRELMWMYSAVSFSGVSASWLTSLLLYVRRLRVDPHPAPGGGVGAWEDAASASMYIHTYVRTYIQTYMHPYVLTYIHTYVRTYVHYGTYVHACIQGVCST